MQIALEIQGQQQRYHWFYQTLPVSSRCIRFGALLASSNKCLEGAPGLGFCLASKDALEATQGNSDSLCLDLYQQWKGLEVNGQWRFTTLTHCILAFDQALQELDEEGGVSGRGGRYRTNCDLLVTGMRELGFETLLPDELQAPIIVTFRMPADAAFNFQSFYDGLSDRGYIIYPRKLTIAESFRMSCIGRLDVGHMRGALNAVREVMAEMGVASGSPTAS